MNWDRTRDVRRAPSLMYSDSDGCGHAFLYGWSDDRTEAMVVRADKDDLGLSTTPKAFDLSAPPRGLELFVHIYERPVRSFPYCTDVGIVPPLTVETWRVVGGTMTVTLSAPGMYARSPDLYRATIRLVGAQFVSATGARVSLPRPVTLTAVVGWVSG